MVMKDFETLKTVATEEVWHIHFFSFFVKSKHQYFIHCILGSEEYSTKCCVINLSVVYVSLSCIGLGC